MYTMVSLKECATRTQFIYTGASIIGEVNSKATLTLYFSLLAEPSCDVLVHDVHI